MTHICTSSRYYRYEQPPIAFYQEEVVYAQINESRYEVIIPDLPGKRYSDLKTSAEKVKWLVGNRHFLCHIDDQLVRFTPIPPSAFEYEAGLYDAIDPGEGSPDEVCAKLADGSIVSATREMFIIKTGDGKEVARSEIEADQVFQVIECDDGSFDLHIRVDDMCRCLLVEDTPRHYRRLGELKTAIQERPDDIGIYEEAIELYQRIHDRNSELALICAYANKNQVPKKWIRRAQQLAPSDPRVSRLVENGLCLKESRKAMLHQFRKREFELVRALPRTRSCKPRLIIEGGDLGYIKSFLLQHLATHPTLISALTIATPQPKFKHPNLQVIKGLGIAILFDYTPAHLKRRFERIHLVNLEQDRLLPFFQAAHAVQLAVDRVHLLSDHEVNESGYELCKKRTMKERYLHYASEQTERIYKKQLPASTAESSEGLSLHYSLEPDSDSMRSFTDTADSADESSDYYESSDEEVATVQLPLKRLGSLLENSSKRAKRSKAHG